MPEIVHDDVAAPRPRTVLQRIAGKIRGDALIDPSDSSTGLGFPYSYAEAYQRPIGSMFPSTLQVTDEELIDFHQRYPMGKRIVDLPVDESITDQFRILIDGQENEKAMVMWRRYKGEWKRYFKLTRLFGHCEMLYGWKDDQSRWQMEPQAEGVKYEWIAPVSKRYEQNLEETDTFPNKIKMLSVNYGNTSIIMLPERFTFSMLQSLTEDSKKGESSLIICYNLLQIQIHADWSIGQALFRRASGLLAIFAPKRLVSTEEKENAIASVANHNSKTALYMPFGWNIKDVLKPGGNMAIARTYALITEQMAAATGIPESILTGVKTPTDASSGDKEMFYNLVETFQKDIEEPALKDWMRKSQKAGMIDPGNITIDFGKLQSKNELERERELTQLGAMKLLQARMDISVDQTSKTITMPLAEGTPDTPDLVKIITPKK